MEEDYLLDSYEYELPEEMIAQTPAQPVESAKLLIWSQKTNLFKIIIFMICQIYLQPMIF